MICAASIFQEPDATRAPLLPDRSVVPCANFATVEASYAAIPHRRTEFPSQAPGFSQMEAAYLRLMFKLVDQAIVVRVDAGAELVAGQSAAEHLVAYDELIRCAESIPAPASLQKYHEKIAAALAAQRAVIQTLHRQAVLGTRAMNLDTMPGVRISSELLRQAYTMLMTTFPAASQQAQEAFFDYHCALDFI